MKDMADLLTITAVPHVAVDIVWPDVAPMLERAVATAGGRYSIESVYEEIASGQLALWLVLDDARPIAALTTRVLDFPCKRVLSVDWIAGSRMAEWLPLTNAVFRDYAKSYGCSQLEGRGRKGWLRELTKHGWELDYMAYRMELNDG